MHIVPRSYLSLLTATLSLASCDPQGSPSLPGAALERALRQEGDGGRESELRYNLERGRAFVGRGEFRAAVRNLSRGFELDSSVDGPGLELARCLIELERYEQAIDVLGRFQEISELSPGTSREMRRIPAQLFHLEGLARKGLGQFRKAQRALEAASDRGPLDPESRALLGNVLALQGRHEESLPHLRAALDDLEARHRRRGAAEVHYQLARSLRALGRESEASMHFRIHRKMREQDVLMARLERRAGNSPDSAEAYLDLGIAQLRRGLPGLASRSLEKARSLSPGRADVLAALAVCRLDQRRLEDARPLIEESLASRPTAAGYYARALRHERVREHHAAREALDRALGLLELEGPGNLFGDEIRALDLQLDER